MTKTKKPVEDRILKATIGYGQEANDVIGELRLTSQGVKAMLAGMVFVPGFFRRPDGTLDIAEVSLVPADRIVTEPDSKADKSKNVVK
jgi:hypothetical protein